MTFASSLGPTLPVLIVGFLIAAAIALLVTPSIVRLVRAREMVDVPDERRVHDRPLPRGGGVAVLIAFVIVGGGLVLVGALAPDLVSISGTEQPLQLAGLFGGGVLAAVLGVIDDRFDLRARWQFLGQLVVAIVAVACGISVAYVGNPFGSGILPIAAPIGVAFTVLWIVGMINSLNFIDGLDGLSSGIAFIAAVTLGLVSLTVQVNQPLVAVLCFVLAGGVLGFLRWNFHPAIVFQGTAGVMFLGYTLAVLAILGQAKVIAALLVLAVPIIDTFWVIVRRLSSGRSPFSPDRGHIHHRLLDVGLSHRATVLLIYGICATLGLMSLVLSNAAGVVAFGGALVVFGVLAFVLRQPASEASS